MKKLKLSVWTILILAVFSSFAFAEDSADVNIIGFSQSGKYFAFEEFGINDDEDDKSAYSTIYIVNVATNSFAVAPFKAEGKGTAPGKRIYGKNAQKLLKKFGVFKGYVDLTNTPKLGMDNPETDHPTPKPRNGKTLPTDLDFTINPNSSLGNKQDFEVKINKISMPREDCSEFKRDMFSFEMSLKSKNLQPIILQKAGKTCADAYGIDFISVYRNNFAVMVASLSKNSKGPDNRYFVVTGEIK